MSDRAAFAGLAQNRRQPQYARLQMANQALDQYVAIEDELWELLNRWTAIADDPLPDTVAMGPGYRVASQELREILEKKR